VALVDRRALRTQRALVVGAAGIALDVEDLAVGDVDQRAAPDRAVRTDARDGFRVLDAQLLGARDGRRQARADGGQAAEGGSANSVICPVKRTSLHSRRPFN
jgi:hypothetical protein